jgi:hypothetical protein
VDGAEDGVDVPVLGGAAFVSVLVPESLLAEPGLVSEGVEGAEPPGLASGALSAVFALLLE